MDVGLVCDQCDAFNAMASSTCVACGASLQLGSPKKTRSTGDVVGRTPAAAPPARAPTPGQTPTPAEATPRPAAQAAGGTAASASRFCAECGEPLQPAHKFCGKCGARCAEPQAARPAASAGERPRTMFFGAMQMARAKLTLIRGDGMDGISFTLAGQEHIAGRLEGPLLFSDDPFLSPRHANFFYKDHKLCVRDDGSANGVFIRIRAPMPARSGDAFLIGEQVLRVETTPPETAGLGPDETGTYYFASPRRPSRLKIVQLLRGGDYGLVFRAASDVITIGREGNDVNFPDDPFISGRHAQVAFGDAGLVMTDLTSKNGTFHRIRGEALLQHGDYLFMGQQLLRVEIV